MTPSCPGGRKRPQRRRGRWGRFFSQMKRAMLERFIPGQIGYPLTSDPAPKAAGGRLSGGPSPCRRLGSFFRRPSSAIRQWISAAVRTSVELPRRGIAAPGFWQASPQHCLFTANCVGLWARFLRPPPLSTRRSRAGATEQLPLTRTVAAADHLRLPSGTIRLARQTLRGKPCYRPGVRPHVWRYPRAVPFASWHYAGGEAAGRQRICRRHKTARNFVELQHR